MDKVTKSIIGMSVVAVGLQTVTYGLLIYACFVGVKYVSHNGLKPPEG